jgi:hypothetical protein
MIMLGLVDEGMACIAAVRERYDGERRNPWNEFECGNNYARSMASYALLNAFSGFQFDMVNGLIGFNPVRTDNGNFRCFWSLDAAWGEFVMTPTGAEIQVLAGALPLQQIKLPFLDGSKAATISIGGHAAAATARDGGFVFDAPVTIGAGQRLVIG